MVEQTLHLALPITVGIIIGVMEAYFVYEDENMASASDFLKDMWHGVLVSIFGVLIATNVPYLLNLDIIPSSLKSFLFVDSSGTSPVICFIIMIFMMVKMVATHALKGVNMNGFQEKFWHKLFIAALVGFSPYYIFALEPYVKNLIGPYLPEGFPF
jgi:hypothetical protein